MCPRAVRRLKRKKSLPVAKRIYSSWSDRWIYKCSFTHFQLNFKKKNPLHYSSSPLHNDVFKALKVKAVYANQAESRWVFFLGFPPLILCSSPSGLGAGSIHPVLLLVACWNMPWLVALPEWKRERETCGQQYAAMRCSAQWEKPAAPIGRLLLMSDCTHWRASVCRGIEELHYYITAR